MALGQVVAMGGGGWTMDDPVLDRFVTGLVSADRPKICFIPTASGDHPASEGFFDAFPADRFDASIPWLFNREVADIDAFLGAQDIVYVGGGNTVSMLAVWRVHGVDDALRAAHDSGVVMAGISAGANCWFEACTTDSFQLGRADPLRDGARVRPRVVHAALRRGAGPTARGPRAGRLGWVAGGLRVRRIRRRPPRRWRAPRGDRVASRRAGVPGGRGGRRDA
jgi:hypothetical protein